MSNNSNSSRPSTQENALRHLDTNVSGSKSSFVADKRAQLRDLKVRTSSSKQTSASKTAMTTGNPNTPSVLTTSAEQELVSTASSMSRHQQQIQRLEQLRNSRNKIENRAIEKREEIPISETPSSSQSNFITTVTPMAVPQDYAIRSQLDSQYEAFVHDLKCELSTHHTDLWQGFQQQMLSLPDQQPLTDTPQQKHRLLPISKQILSTMHRHLKEQYPSHTYCATPQLIKDKPTKASSHHVSHQDKQQLQNQTLDHDKTLPSEEHAIQNEHYNLEKEKSHVQRMREAKEISISSHKEQPQRLPKVLEKTFISRQAEEDISKQTPNDAKESSHEEQSRHRELHLQEEQENLLGQEEHDLQPKQKRHHILQQEHLNLQCKEEETNIQRRKEAPIIIKQENQIKQDRHYESREYQARQVRGQNLQHGEIQTNIQRQNEAPKWGLRNTDRTQTHSAIQQQQDLPRKEEVQRNIHEETIPPESQQKQQLPPLSPSATKKYHPSHSSKTSKSPQCEALTPSESSTLNINYSLASLRTPQQPHRLVNPVSVGIETASATTAAKIPLVKLKRRLSNSKPKIVRSNSAGKTSPVKEELYSRKALRSVDQSKKKKPQPQCDGLFNASKTEKHSSPCKLDYGDEVIPTSSYAASNTNAEVPRSFDGFSLNASQNRDASSLSATKEHIKTSSYPCSIQIGTRFALKEINLLFHGTDEKDITVFSLLPTSSNGSSIVALGANEICMVKLLENQSMGEVQWASHRKAVASLTLTGDGTGAKLTSLDGLSSSQTLLFSSCLECLRFAQEFYGVKPPAVRSPIIKNIDQFEGELAKPPTQNNNIPSQGKARIDDISSENDIRGEGNESSASPLPIPGPVSSSEQLLNEAEEEIAVKYRTLLKTSTRKAVKHRMMMDRIPSKILNVVLSYDEGTGDDDERRVPEDRIISDPRSALLASISKGEVPEEKTTSDPRSALLAAIKSKKEVHEDNTNSDPRSALLAAIKSKSGFSANSKEKEPLKNDPATKVTGDNCQVSLKSNLTAEEEEVANKFRKMIKMRIPIDAVKHKMTLEQVDSKIVKVVLMYEFENVCVNSSETNLTAEENEVADKYRKMLRMHVPQDAVRHKMIMEQVDAKIVSVVLSSILSDNDVEASVKSESLSSGSACTVRTINNEEEVAAEKYRKMLKMHIPKEAVRHKMKMEQADPKIILAVLGEETQMVTESVNTVKSKLTPEEDEVAEKYRKMLKLLIPKDAVRHKMIGDQVAAKIIHDVLGPDDPITPEATTKSTLAAGRQTAAQSRRRDLVGLHWTPLSPNALENSIWGTQMNATLMTPGDTEIRELEKIFQKKKITKTPMKDGSNKGDGNDQKLAKLIDLTRANNISIGLKAFKEFSLEVFVNIIGDVDPERKIVGERTQFIKALLPQQQELQAVKAYVGDDSALVPAEIFFRHLLKVKRVERKVFAMQVMNSFSDSVREIGQKLDMLYKVCKQVMTSERLKSILENVLIIGNIMNEGTRTGGVSGFKFESLLKLTQTKSSDGKMTVLDYLVRTFMNRKEREILDLASEFPDSHEASKITISDLTGEVALLQKSIKECDAELILMKNDQRGGSCSSKTTSATSRSNLLVPNVNVPNNAFLNAIEQRRVPEDKTNSDPRSAMLAAIKSKTEVLEDKANSDPRSALLAAIKRKKEVPEDKANSDPRSALLAAIKGGKEVPEDKTNSDPRSALLASIKSKSGFSANHKDKEPLKIGPASKVSHNEDTRNSKDDDEITAFQENRLRFEAFSPGVARLENFLMEAKSSMESLKLKENHAIETCRKMANYLGESGGEKSVSQILSVLSGFVGLLSEAIRKHDEREEAMKRKMESAKKKAQHVHATPTTRNGKSVTVGNSASADESVKRNEVNSKKSVMANCSNPNQSQSSVSDGSPEIEQPLLGCNATEAVAAVIANISPFSGRKEASKNSMDSTGGIKKANKGPSNSERKYGPSSSTHPVVPRHNNVNNNVVLKKQYTIVEQGGRKVLHVETVSDSKEDCSRQNL